MSYDELNAEIQKMLRHHLYVSILNFVLVVSVVVAAVLNYFSDYSAWVTIPSASIAGIVILKWLNSLSWSFFSSRISENAMLELVNGIDPHGEQNSSVAGQQQVNLLITALPEAPIGFFKDHSIYEWIDVDAGDNTSKRFEFVGTQDDNYHSSIPEMCILIPPGILYKLKEK